MLTARQFCCALCHQLVQICSYCDHGNMYCSSECTAIARRNSVRQANQRYQNTRRGKTLHAQRQRRYIQQQNDRLNGQNEKVTDQGSETMPNNISLSVEPEVPKVVDIELKIYCHFCGALCSNLLRRDFLYTAVIKKAVNISGYPCGP